MTEPKPLEGEYIWDGDLTVKENLTAATGKAYSVQEEIPTAIILEADWSDKFHVDFDANGGSFPSSLTAGPVLTKYYTPGQACTPPDVQPTMTLALFTGWSLDPLGQTPWTGTDSMSENLHVYAQYESFDPTSQASVNAKYGSSPTVIGQGGVQNAEDTAWTLTIGGDYPDRDTMNKILKNGVEAYESSVEGQAYLALHGALECTGALRNVKGAVSSLVALTGLVDASKTYTSFTVPSTLNGMTVAAERGMLQNLRADTVIFAAAPSGDIPLNTETDSSLFQGNTHVKNVYMDTTAIVKLGDDAFNGCTSLECVTLPGTLQRIGQRAFQGCTKISKAKLGLRVDTLGTDAFRDCTALTIVSVSTPYMSSMKNAFRDTTSNSQSVPAHIDLTLEKTVLLLPSSAFYGCSAFMSLTVADNGRLL